MSDDQDWCEWVSVSSGTGLPGLSWRPGPNAVKRLSVCVCVVSRESNAIGCHDGPFGVSALHFEPIFHLDILRLSAS